MLTIAILNFNGKDYLEDCLYSTQDIDAEKILIDNASTDGSWEIAEKYGFRVAHRDNGHKFITGINSALYEASGDYILFSQADVTFVKGCIKSLYSYAQLYDAPFIQPIFLKNGYVDNAGMKLVWPGYGIGDLSIGKTLGKETEIATSIAFITSRKVIEMVGDYDYNFSPAYYEDVDFALRCRRLGIRHMVCNQAFVNHRHNESFSKVYNKIQISDICRRNRKYLVNKHYKGLDKYLRLSALSVIDETNRAFQYANIAVDAWRNKKSLFYGKQS